MTTCRKSVILFSAVIEDRIWREMLTGVKTLAGRADGWQLRVVSPASLPALIRSEHEEIAGVIGYIPNRNILLDLKERGIPAVATVDLFSDLGIPLVCQNDKAIGRLAAEECLRRGFVNFGTYGVDVHEFARRRRQGFAERVAETAPHACVRHYRRVHGYGPTRLHAMPPQADSAMTGWLKSLPKPAAIFTLNDFFGAHLMQVCARNGLRVPEDIAVVGADDDPLWCELSAPQLASVRTLGEPIGFEAAKALQRRMAGDQSPPETIQVPPLSLTLRQSLDILAIDDPPLAQAFSFLREQAHADVGVKHIVAAARPLSRRTLEIKFEKLLGHGPGEELLRVRLQLAKELLADPRLSIREVAERSGLTSLKRFSCVFSRKVGMTPSAFRLTCWKRA